MITEPVVFILGAGASHPYGFPLGQGLVDTIIRRLDDTESIIHQLVVQTGDIRGQTRLLREFREELIRSREMSIDAFLQHRRRFDAVGRRVIAAIIMEHEKESSLFSPAGCDWYRLLAKMLSAPFAEFGGNRLAFITYNYDRSLEHFLFNAFQGEDTGQESNALWAKKLRETIPIVHLHGQLGLHPEFSGDNTFAAVKYGAAMELSGRTLQAVQQGSRSIRIVHDDIDLDNDPAFGQAYALITGAKCVCFLGFGYDQTNCKRLRLAQYLTCYTCGSAFDMTKAEIEQVYRKTESKLTSRNVGNPDRDCLRLLRENHWLQRFL